MVVVLKVYGRYGCGYTTKLRQYLNQLNEQYQYYILDEDFTREEFYLIYPPHRTFPLIMKDDEYLGGCDDYIEHHSGEPVSQKGDYCEI